MSTKFLQAYGFILSQFLMCWVIGCWLEYEEFAVFLGMAFAVSDVVAGFVVIAGD